MAKSERDKIRNIRLPDGSKAQGRLVFGEIDGYDIFISPVGFKYEGQFKDALFHGDGKATFFAEGKILICKWDTGRPIGDHVTIIQSDDIIIDSSILSDKYYTDIELLTPAKRDLRIGYIYVGKVDSNTLKYSGYGTVTSYQSNEIISGVWEDFHSITCTHIAGRRRYDGEVNSFGRWHGNGVYTSENGEKYEGTFDNGIVDGIKTYHDGTKELGRWKIDALSEVENIIEVN